MGWRLQINSRIQELEVKKEFFWVSKIYRTKWSYLMRWGFMNSVRTEPRVSLLPYSTRVSSPALKIMHTWGWMGLLYGGKIAQRKRQTVEGDTLWVHSKVHFSLYSVPLFHLPILSAVSSTPCHLTSYDTEARRFTVNQLYSHFHFQRNTSHCHQIPAKLPVKGEEDIRNPRITTRGNAARTTGWDAERSIWKGLTLHKRDAMSDFALVPVLLGEGVKKKSNSGDSYSRILNLLGLSPWNQVRNTGMLEHPMETFPRDPGSPGQHLRIPHSPPFYVWFLPH